MLQHAAKRLKPGGYFYIVIPNFANNPGDLFCVDHLSKLTIASLKNLAAHSGFEVVSMRESGVPLFALLKYNNNLQPLENNYIENHSIAEKIQPSLKKAWML